MVRWKPARSCALGLAAIFLMFSAQSFAATSVRPKLSQFPEGAERGSAANQLQSPGAIAVDQTTGHVAVADTANNRIAVFTAWGEFLKSWGWGVEDGSPVLQVCGPAVGEPHCQEGIRGSGTGQLDFPRGVAIDPNGDVYVLEEESLRVQKFSPNGQFLLMFGGEVNETNGGNLCTAVSGNVCKVGVEGAGTGEFSRPPNFSSGYITAGPDGTVYVGDKDRIQKFDEDGNYAGSIDLPLPGFATNLAFDRANGDILFTYFTTIPINEPLIHRLDPDTGTEVGSPLPVAGPLPGLLGAVTVDKFGNIFVVFDASPTGEAEGEPRVIELAPNGGVLISYDQAFAAPATAKPEENATLLSGLAVNEAGDDKAGDLYVTEQSPEEVPAAVSAYGPPPTRYGPPPPKPPIIADQFTSSAYSTAATLKAIINPRFWSDTRYYLEYGPDPCYLGGCSSKPEPPGATLTEAVVDVPIVSHGIELTGLQPATTYHYRFVAVSSGGGPVVGRQGKAGEAGEGTFTTLPPPAAQVPCPGNEPLRKGLSAFLPDCRAYELVSPLDKSGADLETVFNINGDRAELNQSAVDGEAVTYSAYRAFDAPESAPYTSQYLATRGPDGWTGRAISPPREGPSLYNTLQLDSQYQAFSPNLCEGWLLQDTNSPLTEDWTEGAPNVYRRDLCGSSGYLRLVPPRAPLVSEISDFFPEVQGFSSDSGSVLVRAAGKLTNNAQTVPQAYAVTEGGARLVCILPGGAADKSECSAGSYTNGHSFRSSNLSHAISEDGATIYWSNAANSLYVRVNLEETFSIGSAGSHFWGAAADGSVAVYSTGGELFLYDLADKASTPIAGGFKGFLGMAEDGSRVYFASTSVISGSGANPRGEEAVDGEPNLYLFEAGEPEHVAFVATLTADDVNNDNMFPSNTTSWPVLHMAHVSPDGQSLAFISDGSPTGYDSTDSQSLEADTEVYLYRRGAERLTCVSCLPTNARPTGRLVEKGFWVAARLPAAQTQLYTPRVLSDDGSRLFFESFDPLSPRDTNGEQDVYEWEADGAGNCTSASPGYNTAFEGCVNLISSGASPMPSELVDTSPDGRDVFFKTESSLLPQDPGQVDLYDARAGGGFPPPPPRPPGCQGEACQPSTAPPSDAQPASESYEGPGNVAASKSRRCPKGKHAVKRHGKRVCVKDKKKPKSSQGQTNRGRR